MDEHDNDEQHADLVSRLFALVTAKLEDAATIAAECQGRRPLDELLQRAQLLDTLIAEAATVNAGVSALVAQRHD